ncbi:hypothetical protein [Sphingomonas bacterium]|uniref:hypothetical protein n=1 Tax=Sphingomonas bacterium TaxID=1895847 RepID=UPI0015776171|nr:hypothetical protein [Sphingomonas bacterium]
MSRQWYLDDASRVHWVREITIKVEPDLDKSVLAGFIFRSARVQHGGLSKYDYTIILAGNLSEQAERFVSIKELMHCYFDPDKVEYATDTAVALENHMRQMFDESGSGKRSLHVQADGMALWMALGVICPAHIRDAYLASAKSAPAVADELNIPIKQAQNLLSDRFDIEISQILN